jgi:hypothetical protein
MMLSVQQRDFLKQLPELCYDTQLKVGSHMEEKFYQHVLIANLRAIGVDSVYEDVFTYQFTNIHGNLIRIGHGMNARTDIELCNLGMILELKKSNAATKAEHFSQCRNYLIHRDDISIGVVINFISKESNDSGPYTQIDVMQKTGKMIELSPTYSIPEFIAYKTILTKTVPPLSTYVISNDDEI